MFLNSRALLAALFPAVLSACHPIVTTGNPLVDEVVKREGPTSPCVAVGEATRIYAPDPDGPPGMLEAKSFDDLSAQAAAQRIESVWKPGTPRSRAKIYGIGGDQCPMLVGKPAFSGDYAFVGYGTSMRFGAYAFRRENNRWRLVEKVMLGMM